MNDVLMGKKACLERCVKQARLYFGSRADLPFEQDYMRQDAIAANLQRACEQAIDMANHVVRLRKLGLPQQSRDSFVLLAQGGIISPELSRKLQGMVGFRNTLVHQYRQLDLGLVEEVITRHLDDLLLFSDILLKEAGRDT
jgi:uncharacterized protein YutE (UPF0331/DUF86 family)